MPISPNQGPISGGTTITITGVNLSGALSVHFGSQQATITANTPTSITVINPPGNGVANVTVTTNGGTSNFLPFFYIPPPTITSIDPNTGPLSGGNTININGSNLFTTLSVDFGGNSSVPTIISDSQIQVVVPAGSSIGSVPITITASGGIAAGFTYNYVDAPTIITLNPLSGSVLGGTSVTISGTNFSGTTSVTFGGINASFGVINSTTLVTITPPGTIGSVDVVINTTGGSATAVNAYTYVSGPGI
jgi:hypothetical protein